MESVNLIPLFITASTKEQLVTAMLRNNMKSGSHFKYFSIAKEGSEWVAWYYGKAELLGIKRNDNG